MILSAFSSGEMAGNVRHALDEISRAAERVPGVALSCHENRSGFVAAAAPVASGAPLSSAQASREGGHLGVFHGRVYDWGALNKHRRSPAAGRMEPSPADCLVDFCRLGTSPDDIPRELVGDFCFHLWDEARGRLVAAVDPLAVRAIYYAFPNDDCIVIASSTRALRRFAGPGLEVDDDQVVAYLSGIATDPGKTLLKGVYSLPGGHVLEWREGRASVRRYWSPWLERGAASQEEMLAEFHDLVFEALRCRVRGYDRLALLMSGGFDSTSLAGVASRLAGSGELETDRLAILSSVFPGQPCDESLRIGRVTAQLPFASKKLANDDLSLDHHDIEASARVHDMPYFDLQEPMFRQYSEDLEANSACGVITGIGGDEIATDYDYWGDLLVQNGIVRFPRTVRAVAQLESTGYRRAARMLISWWVRESVQPALPAALSRRLGKRWAVNPPAWLDEKWKPLTAELVNTQPADDLDFGSHTLNVRWRLLTSSRSERARRWWYRHWSSQSVDCLAPFFDRRICELVFSTPIQHQPRSFDRGQFKPLIANTIGRYIPADITANYWKVVFDGYETSVFENNRSVIEEYLFEKADWHSERFVSRGAAQRLFAASRPAATEPAGSLTVHQLADIVSLEAWLRVFENELDLHTFVG